MSEKRVKFSGHTMGMPACGIYQAIELFKAIGYDGIEVRVHPKGQIDSESISDEEVKRIRDAANRCGLEFSCLTPYYQNYANLEKREAVIANLKRVIKIASLLDCPLVRLYGGVEPSSEPEIWFADVWSRSVSGIREVAEFAGEFGVRLCIETHISSLTMTIRDTVHLIEDIDMPNVGMLFDYAWIEIGGVEQGGDAVKLASRHIFHVHMKDWKLDSRTPLRKTSCLMGEGAVDWKTVFTALRKTGYQGYITDEYEKLWYPDDLPAPEIGMKHNLEYARSFFRDSPCP